MKIQVDVKCFPLDSAACDILKDLFHEALRPVTSQRPEITAEFMKSLDVVVQEAFNAGRTYQKEHPG
jgi:hypothetical protein